ncbi:MAG: DEAD/DEAH box helicase [Actinomyces sp.]|nr:DEAD/DEAH box helicase [Actinomyces sp.]
MVSLSHTIASMSDDDMMALVGPAAWANGLRLARSGAVREFSWSEDGEQAEARVKEAGLTYRVRGAQGALRPSLTCACPLRTDCPHAVAMLIVGREDAREKRRSVPEWSRVLQQMLGDDHDRLGEPLALVVDAHDPGVEPSLTPLRRGTSAAWTTKRASWLDLTATQWASVTDGLDPTHVSLMREGYRLSRESRSWHSRTEVTLSSLGEHAYAWLARLVRAGVELFTSPEADERVVLSHATWDADIDVRSGDDGLDVRVVARNGDEVITRPRIDRDASVLLLDGGRAIARIEGLGTLDGFPLDRALHIPAADVAEFRGTWLPALLKRFSMASSDGSFDAQARPDVSVVGTVRRDGESVVVRWWAEYLQGESRSRTPVAHCMEDEAVAEIVRRVESWGRGMDSALWSAPPRTGRLAPWRVPAFLEEVVDTEGVDGLVWDVAEDVRAIEVREDGFEVDLNVDPAERDWFDLNVRLRLGNVTISVREALEAIAGGQDYVEVAGTWVRLDGERIRSLATLLEEARTLVGWDGEGVRLTPMQVGVVDLFATASDHVAMSDAWRMRIAPLRDASTDAGLPPLPSLATILRPYQRRGHAWLTARLSGGIGGILADDMGLGKTVQILSAVAALRAHAGESSPVLVVVPTSVVGVWIDQARTFTPALEVRAVKETATRRGTTIREEVENADIVVTSYTLARLESEQWSQVRLGGLVIDEAQAVKNPRTATYRALRDLDAPWKLAVSGTPIENSLSDLWSLLSLTCPGLLPPWETFQQQVRRPIENGSDPAMLARLSAYVAPFVLRRTKEEVAPDLPDKIVDVVRVDLGKEHRHIYDQFLARERARILDLLRDVDANRMSVLASITRLRQLALDPALVEESYAHVGSAKIEYLADRLDEIVPLGHQALVFSQFTSFLERIRHMLERRGISVVQLDGSTRGRAEVIEKFRSGQAQVFLISLKAGGSGLTLTEADYVYVMDPWWNPAAEEQAIDRAHRIGQTKKVNVYRMVATDTIEAKVVELQDRKRQLISSVMNGTGTGARLSEADLRGLLD